MSGGRLLTDDPHDHQIKDAKDRDRQHDERENYIEVPVNRETSCCKKRKTGSNGNDSMIYFVWVWLYYAHGLIHSFGCGFAPHLFCPHYLPERMICHEWNIFFVN